MTAFIQLQFELGLIEERCYAAQSEAPVVFESALSDFRYKFHMMRGLWTTVVFVQPLLSRS
jgi:hypothetical protein